jgi:predicted deacetylase
MLQKLNISIHDITKSNLEKVYYLKDILEDLGVSKITYLLIPCNHEKENLLEIKEDLENFKANGEFVLHGYSHKSGCFKGLKSLFTNCEGEFLYYQDLEDRLKKGLEILNKLNIHSKGFIPPAWLMRKEDFKLLKQYGFRFTEDRLYIYDLQKDRKILSPVLSFGSRGIVEVVSKLSFRAYFYALRFSKINVIRIALHPIDAIDKDKIRLIVKTLKGKDFKYMHLQDLIK